MGVSGMLERSMTTSSEGRLIPRWQRGAEVVVRALAAALALAWAVSGATGCMGADASRASADLEVEQAIFQYQLDKHCSGGRSGLGACFLQLPDKSDPSDELLAMFTNHNPPVRPVSAAKVSSKDAVTDPDSGKPGKVLVIGWMQFRHEDVVTATGTEYTSPSNGSMHTYTVERRGDTWSVTNDERHGR